MALREVDNLSLLTNRPRSPGGEAKSPPPFDIDYAHLTEKMQKALDFRTIYSTIMAPPPPSSPPAPPPMDLGMVTLLKPFVDQAVSKNGSGDGAQPILLKILDIMEARGNSDLKGGIDELREALMRPAPPDETTKLHSLAETMMLLKGGEAPPADPLAQVRALIELVEMIRPQQVAAPPASPVAGLLETVTLFERLQSFFGPKQAPQAPVVQLGNLGQMPFNDYFKILEFQQSREDKKEERDLKREQFKTGREMFEGLAGAITEAAEEQRAQTALEAKAETPASKKIADPSTRLHPVNCDYCGARNQVKYRAASFVCGGCAHTCNVEGWDG